MLVIALSTTRIFTGADDITSSGTLRAAVIAAIPIALAGLGGLWSERAGVVNIGLEGMMILGTLGAGYFTYHYGVWVGLLGAAVFGAVGGALHALATVTFGVDHIVSGVAINIIALGVASFLAEALFTGLPGGGPTQSPSLDRPPTISVPGLSGWTESLEDKGWFLVSDLAALLNVVVSQLSLFTLVALVLIFGTGWLLWRTAVRPAAPLVRRVALGRGDPRRQRLPLQVRRGHHVRGARRHGWRVPRAGGLVRLPERADRRPRATSASRR